MTIGRQPSSDEERAARAEAEAFRPGIERSNTSKNRTSQVLLVLALIATFVGGSLALVGSNAGLVLFIVGLPVTVVTGVWCFRNWDY